MNPPAPGLDAQLCGKNAVIIMLLSGEEVLAPPAESIWVFALEGGLFTV